MTVGPKIKRRTPLPGVWVVTKQQVVATELSRALRLYVIDGDYVSAHLLAGAARDILQSMLREAGKNTLWSVVKNAIKEEHQKEFYGILKEEYNFFKHAEKDGADATLNFSPKVTELFLWEIALNYQTLFGHRAETDIFIEWYTSNYPETMSDDYNKAVAAKRAQHPREYGPDGKMTRTAMIDMLLAIESHPSGEFPSPLLRDDAAKAPD